MKKYVFYRGFKPTKKLWGVIMTRLENIIQDLKDLRGKEVKVFGQPYLIPLASEENNLLIDTIELLENFKNYEVKNLIGFTYNDELEEDEEEIFDSIEEYIEFLEEVEGFSQEKSDNSYNWSSPLNHDINFTMYSCYDGKFYVELSCHRYGDVRCNYTNSCLLAFNDEEEFLDTIQEANKYIEVEIEGDIFEARIEVLSNDISVSNYEKNLYFDVYASTLEELREEIIGYLVD